MIRQWGVRLMTWPSWLFGLLAITLPLDLLTRSITWFYPVAVPALVIGTVLLVKRILNEEQTLLLLGGVVILATTGLADMASAAFLAATGNFVPWGLGLFVVLQATTLARRFLTAFERTEALLAEKELLVKEVHHRVKNSLQVVASLVSLQSNRLQDPAQKAVFSALRQRITAISLVHEKLYGQSSEVRPDLGEYLLDLLLLQFPRDGLGAGKVTWEVYADPLVAGVDYCIDAGLILTELVSNAHKHSLVPRGGGKLEVAIRIRESRLGIEVRDDGPGFPADFRPEAALGLGFRLVLALLQRNEGTMEIGAEAGARVRVELRLPSAAG
jgi:two-component sensor histidine kinase